MKTICKFLIVILFFSIATECFGMDEDYGIGVKSSSQNLEVDIPDPALESAIRKAIGKPYAPIYVKDLEGLTELDAHFGKIADLTGLEYCTNLEELNLWGNKITDIAPLSELVNLEYLNLTNNMITDISPLSKLVNLEWLDLWDNPLSSESINVYIPILQQRGVVISF